MQKNSNIVSHVPVDSSIAKKKRVFLNKNKASDELDKIPTICIDGRNKTGYTEFTVEQHMEIVPVITNGSDNSKQNSRNTGTVCPQVTGSSCHKPCVESVQTKLLTSNNRHDVNVSNAEHIWDAVFTCDGANENTGLMSSRHVETDTTSKHAQSINCSDDMKLQT